MKQFTLNILHILNRRERVTIIRLILLDLLIGALDIAFLAGILLVINYYTSNKASNSSFLFPIKGGKNSLLVIGIFFLLFAFKNLLGYFISASGNSFFYEVASRLSRLNILHYLKDDYIKFINANSSVHVRKISQQPIEFSNYILINIQQIITQSALIFFTVVAILLYHPVLFLLLFLLLSPPVVLLAWFIKQQLSNVRATVKVTSEKTIQHLQESLSGYIESNIYNKNTFFIDRYHGFQKKLNKNISTQQNLQVLPSRLIEVFAIFGLFILIVISKILTRSNAIDLPAIGVFMAASYKIIPGIIKILNSTGQIKTYRFTVDGLLESNLKNTESNPHVTIPINSLEFNSVWFKYKQDELLNGLSFSIIPGDFAGISGSSGRGKTTLINLLLGFLVQESGLIRINYQATNNCERHQYWPKIAYVKQQPFFINDTICKNITLTDEDHNTEKLVEVLLFCGITEMLDQYPEGINKQVSENGKNISGGQRQRIMLARALYHEFDLLILDEPFSEMDEAAEKILLEKLVGLAQKGKMILFITHNKNSLAYCNKIISLNGE